VKMLFLVLTYRTEDRLSPVSGGVVSRNIIVQG
jgi:hypothetical protein